MAKKVQVPFSVKEMECVLDDLTFEDTFEGVRDRLIIEMFYVTGMRKAELIGLKVSDVDMISNTLKVLGKRNKERIIPITPSIVLRVQDYLRYRDLVVIGKKQSYLFGVIATRA